MAILLDARTSQGASYANSIAMPITAVNTPELFGQVGLDLTTSAAAGIIRVQFTGVIGVQVPILPTVTTVTITVVRGLLSTDELVFSESSNLELSVLGPQVVAFSGSDYNVPHVDFQPYTAFVSVNIAGVIRVGPESFNATAVSD